METVNLPDDPDDAVALAAFQGATFGPNATLELPSGKRLTAEEANKATRHPIAAPWPDRWQFHPDYLAYMTPDPNGGRPNVTIEFLESATDATIVIPAGSLVTLARGLLAAHVDGSRPEWRGKT